MSDDVSSTSKPPPLADDLLRGAVKIGRAYNRPATGVYYDYARGRMPIGKDGKDLIAFESQIQQHIKNKIRKTSRHTD